jgi:hypothetical protein
LSIEIRILADKQLYSLKDKISKLLHTNVVFIEFYLNLPINC